jgi:hypothetical protein
MADVLYTRGIPEWFEFTTGTYRVLQLKGSGYTVNKDHDFVSDLTVASNENDATDYVRKTLSNPTESIDDTNDRVTYDADDIVWTGLGGATNATVSAHVLYRFITNDAASILMGYYDTTDTATNNTDFTFQVSSSGLGYFDQGA